MDKVKLVNHKKIGWAFGNLIPSLKQNKNVSWVKNRKENITLLYLNKYSL